jgi:hypothetical protein
MVDMVQHQPVHDTQEQRALEVAWNAVAGMNIQKAEFRVIKREDSDTWTFTLLPNARVRGGGAEVTIAKSDLAVRKIMYLQ